MCIRDSSQELRATYDNGGPFTAMLGGSYLYTFTQASYPNVGNEVMTGLPRNIGTSIGAPQQARTLAGFFGASYQFTDRLKVNVDARYQRDRIYFFAGYNGLTITEGNGFNLPAGRTEPFDVAFTKDFKTFLPRIIVQYDLTDDVMGYASYSKGANITLSQFNSGVFNSSPTAVEAAQGIGLQPSIDPERLDNYEIGLKGRLFDGKANFQLSAYYARWKDQINQRSTFIMDEPAPLGRDEMIYVVGNANAGDVTLKGIELDINASPIDGLLINASGALNDSSIREYSNPAFSKLTGVIGDDFKGNQIASSSKYSATAGLQYGTDINSWDDGSWFVRGDLSYKSRVFISEANLAWLPARTVVNFRAGISRGDVKFEAFMLNAFNNRGYTSGIEQNINAPNGAGAPSASGYVLLGLPDLRRTGVKVSYSF
jgi:iron complex outermembrane receptor protein